MQELLDALGYVGSLADKAGPRPLRGLLGGKPREALSFVPFSDTMGLTDPKDIQSGRDLTNKWGWTSPHDTGWGAHLAGIGTEMALDPLALAGGGLAAVKGAGELHKALMAGARASMPGKGRLNSFGLMFDHAPAPTRLARSAPEFVNNKTWYHGSGTPNLMAETLDPTRTATKNLYGPGIYKTADEGIARGYQNKGLSQTPSLYQAQPSFGSVLDLEQGMSPRGYDDLYESLMGNLPGGRAGQSERSTLHGMPEFRPHPTRPMQPGPLIQHMKDAQFRLAMQGYIPENEQLVIRALKELGYDAMTHTGGTITGGDKLHQVLIGLDPNDVLGLGRKTPYQRWEPMR